MPRPSDTVALANALRGMGIATDPLTARVEQGVGEALQPFVGPENPPVNAALQGLAYMTGPENPPVHALMQGMQKAQPAMDLMQLGAMPMMAKGPKTLAELLRTTKTPANEPIRELMHWERGPIKYWRPEETEMVPVSELQKLMEYDRAGVGANVDSLDNIKALEDHIKAYGLENPLMIRYWKPDRKAIIGEGNHRLAAALRAGIEELPARVYGEDFSVGKRGTMEGRRRMPVDVRGHLPGEYGKGELRPSEIGIPSRPLTPEEAALGGKELDIGYPEGYRTFHEQLDDEDWKIIRDLKEKSANRKLTAWKQEEGKLDPETKKLLDLLGW